MQEYRLQHRQGPCQSRPKKEPLSLQIEALRYEIDTLREIALDWATRTRICKDWETRTRICKAINDKYMKVADIKVRVALLKDKDFDYLPYFISLWAVYNNKASATRFLDDVGHTQWARYVAKAEDLDDEGVEAVRFVWDALHETDRSLMIAMWLTRPPSRSYIAFVPTVNEGIGIIDLDHRLSEEEKSLAQQLIPKALDKYAEPLFTDVK